MLKINTPPIQLAAKTWGNPGDPLVIALHGWLDNAGTFDYLAPEFDGVHWVALDFPGHGHSDPLPEELEYASWNYCQFVVKAIQELSNQPVRLVGHSLGGAVAVLLASQHPEWVSHLSLIDALGPISKETVVHTHRLSKSIKNIVRGAKQEHSTYPDLETAARLRAQVGGMSLQEALPLAQHGTRAVSDGIQWCYDKRAQQKSSHFLDEAEVLKHLEAIQCPTLLVQADDGILSDNPIARARVDAFQHLVGHHLVEGHHHVHLQRPQAVAQLIRDFWTI